MSAFSPAAEDPEPLEPLLRRLVISEASLRLALDAGEIGTWDLDVTTGTLYWSDRTKAVFGYAPEDDCSMEHFYAGLHPDDLDSTSAAFASALDPVRRSTYDVEYRTIGAYDGKLRWVAAKGRGLFDDEGRCYRAIGTAIDITARKQLEARLQANEASLRDLNRTLEERVAASTAERDSAWNHAQDLLAVLDDDGRFLSVNPAWTEHLGWRPEDLIGQRYEAFVASDDLAITHDAWEVARIQPLRGFENRIRHMRGGDAWFSWTATYDAGRTYASGRDITDQKRQAQELADAQNFVRHAQKIEALSQLSGGIAHDFNNLMMVLSGSLDLLSAPSTSDVQRERCLAFMQQAIDRGTRLTRQLLTFSRRKPPTLEPVDIGAQLAAMREVLARSLGATFTLTVELADDLWCALADGGEFELSVLNLCVNARDAMPSGGLIQIRVANEPNLAWRGLQGDFVRLSVIDHGEGMADEVVERVFEPFYTTKAVGKGTGLGLPQVLGFAKQAGGEVAVQSALGLGTTVDVWLPRARDCVSGAPTHVLVERSTLMAASAGTALVVDDEPEVGAVIAGMLVELGYTVERAGTADEAMKRFVDGSLFALVVTDVVMPGHMTGVDLARYVLANYPQVPVLLSSGYTRGLADDVKSTVEILIKPYRLDALASAVARAKQRVVPQ